MNPFDCLTIPYTVERPSPVPLPTSLVVKNGSKTWARVSSSIPVPVSVTASSAKRPGSAGQWSRAYSASIFTRPVSIVSRPPVGMESREFTARFMITCSS